MALDRSRGLWIVLLSFFAAFVLEAISIPEIVPAYFSYARPHWIELVLFFWVMSLPHRFGLGTAWVAGLIMDVLHGGLLGQQALACLFVGYVAASFYQRMRMFSVWQQAIILFVTTLLADMALFAINTATMDREWQYLYLLPSLVTALLWPWFSLVLRYCRRRFNVY